MYFFQILFILFKKETTAIIDFDSLNSINSNCEYQDVFILLGKKTFHS